MATATFDRPRDEARHEYRFALIMALAMAATVIIGFSTQFLLGRSTFASPLRVHVHAVLFMGWVAIFVTQSWLATRGPLALHRKLGWLALGWIAMMMAAAMVVIVAMARNGTVPFFFTPQHFLIADPLSLVSFVVMTGVAIAMRRRTDWHARLQIGAMTQIMGPAFGRMLPMPLMIPYAFEAAGAASSMFLVAGMVRDKRRQGWVHPAWWVGVAALIVTMAASQLIARSSVGEALYQSTVAGYPGAQVPGLEYPPPPATPLITGR